MAQRLISTPSDPRVERGLRAQLADLDRRVRVGEIPVGWKIALNSPRVQERYGIPGPLLGSLTGATQLEPGASLRLDPAHTYLIEAEVGVRLKRDVPSGTSEGECATAIDSCAPALELLDMSSGLGELEAVLAGNGFHAAFALGEARRRPPALAELELALRAGDREPLGLDPELLVGELPAVVRFVADLLGALGRKLRAGEWILCGSLNPVARVRPGARVEVGLEPLGALALRLE